MGLEDVEVTDSTVTAVGSLMGETLSPAKVRSITTSYAVVDVMGSVVGGFVGRSAQTIETCSTFRGEHQ